MTDSWVFACPRCHASLAQTAIDEITCGPDGLRFQKISGIWRLLLPDRRAYFEQFVHEYETVRRAEGRGSQDPAYYRALPYQDLSGKMSMDWHIRAATFDTFLKKVLAPLEHHEQKLHVLDLGAGNGWLSNRLAQHGHSVAAVDLLVNDFDGLGCHAQYDSTFVPVQAEFDRLPFPDSAADLIIFNASLHYSVDIRQTLAESLRVLGQEGRLVILDSPIYQDARSGEKMVRERESQFRQRFGFPSNSLPSQNFLTYSLLAELKKSLNLDWKLLTPFYGFRWMLRPLKAKLSGNREPAKFHLVIGTSRNMGAYS